MEVVRLLEEIRLLEEKGGRIFTNRSKVKSDG